MSCINCRAPLASGARFCATCGAAQQAQAFGPDPRDAPSPASLSTDAPPTSWPAPAASSPPPTGGSRRRLIVPVGIALVALVVAAVVVPRLIDGGGGDGPPVMRSLSGGADVPLRSGQIGEPERKWSVGVDVSAYGILVRDRSLFAVEADDDVELVARSLSDGETAWTVGLPGISALFDVEAGLLVQVVGDSGSEPELRSYDPGTGDLRWKAELDDAIYQLSREGDRLVGSTGRQVVAFQADTGEELWSEPAGFGQFVVDGGRVYFADGDEVRALSLRDGEQVWSADVPDEAERLVLAGERIVVGVEDEVFGLSARSGEQEWRADGAVGDSPTLNVVSSSTVVAVDGDDAVAIDARSGKVGDDDAFRVDGADWSGFAYGLPGGDILVFDHDSKGAVILDGDTGERIGRVEAGFQAASPSMIYGTDDDGELSAYRLDNLERAWSIEVDDVETVAVGDGLIVVRTDDGYELWS